MRLIRVAVRGCSERKRRAAPSSYQGTTHTQYAGEDLWRKSRVFVKEPFDLSLGKPDDSGDAANGGSAAERVGRDLKPTIRWDGMSRSYELREPAVFMGTLELVCKASIYVIEADDAIREFLDGHTQQLVRVCRSDSQQDDFFPECT